ncbi:MAG TPA: EAL domain-containing protein [Solirubrobacteraceae bacterium]|nr:EAL domain-containing protein [Solirubrobacteraceae bacterium]
MRRGTGLAFPLWQVHLAVGGLLCSLYVLVPPFAGNPIVMNVLGLSPVVAILVGLRRYRPASPAPWWCFAAGLFLFWLGDVYTYSYELLLGSEVPFPSLGDAAYLLVYPALMVGLFLLVRRRNPEGDRAGVIDSLIMTLGLALISWVALIAPYLRDDQLSVIPKLVSIAYPLGDILLLAAAIRLAVDAGKRAPAFYLLAGSIVTLLLTDFVYGLVTLNGTYTGQLTLDAGWIAFYLLWGAAALHPSMRELEQAAPDRDMRLRPVRLSLLLTAAVIAPVIEMAQEIEQTDDLIVVNVASIVLFGLVVVRIAGLVHQQERSVSRERILRAAGDALVAATRREDIHHAALDAARSLVDRETAALLCTVEDGELSVVAMEPAVREQSPRTLSARTTETLLTGAAEADGAALLHLDQASRAELRLPHDRSSSCVLGLSVRGELRGLLVVACDDGMSRTVRTTLKALATQVSLALESAALTEEVHRRTSEARFGSLVQHSSDLITVLDSAATVVYQSPSIERVLGYRPEDVVGMPFARLVDSAEHGRLLHLLADGGMYAGSEAQVLECSLRHRDGSVRQFEILHTNLLDDEHVHGIVLNGRDVSERKAFEEQLSHQAFHDPVTNLANRALFGERVRHAVARARRERCALAVIFVDLDDFKTINDSLGHAAGDEVLREVAKRLTASIRASDTAARFGGDEFAILLEDVDGPQTAADTAERILEVLGAPLSVEHKQLAVRASLGISVVDGDVTGDADELIRNADAAMYIAKRDGKGGYRLFEPAMHEGVLERLELRADLQRAITSDQLELNFQPVVRLADGSVAGMEALVRWRHPERGMIGPDQFIPLAEEMGLIVPLGRWVLREGCRRAKAFQTLHPLGAPLSMAINLSVKQLQHSDIVGDVRDALAESRLDAGDLTLEITESVMMNDTDLVIERLEELKSLGVRLAMDDFGTGYSSLSYLSRLPVDILKMDRSFLRAGATPEASGLATAVVALGKTLRLDIVAEGIEYAEQCDTLRGLGCELGQGYHFAKPMDGDSMLEFLRAHAASTPVRELSAADAP